MKRLSLMLATLAWLVTGQVSPAWAIWMPGNTFVEQCLDDAPLSKTLCVAYVTGVADMLGVISFSKVAGVEPYCAPDGTKPGQLFRVVVKYLKAHPEDTHKLAVWLVVTALREAFPCQT